MGERVRYEPSEEVVSSSGFKGTREGEILCDRHRKECYQVSRIDEMGVALHRDGTDFYIPHSLFVTWYGRRLFPIDGSGSIALPEWC